MVRAQGPDCSEPGFLQQPGTQAQLLPRLSKPHPHTSPAELSDHITPFMRPFNGSALTYFCPHDFPCSLYADSSQLGMLLWVHKSNLHTNRTSFLKCKMGCDSSLLKTSQWLSHSVSFQALLRYYGYAICQFKVYQI